MGQLEEILGRIATALEKQNALTEARHASLGEIEAEHMDLHRADSARNQRIEDKWRVQNEQLKSQLDKMVEESKIGSDLLLAYDGVFRSLAGHSDEVLDLKEKHERAARDIAALQEGGVRP